MSSKWKNALLAVGIFALGCLVTWQVLESTLGPAAQFAKQQDDHLAAVALVHEGYHKGGMGHTHPMPVVPQPKRSVHH